MNPLARQEIWIIADADSADKMLKFHELRNLAATHKNFEQWYLFKNFDIFTQSASHYGNALIELELGLNKTLSVRKRAPHSIILLIGDSILEDDILSSCPGNVRHVLSEVCNQVKRMMQKWISFLPAKAKPLHDVQFFINKPLPKPESPFLRWNAMDTFHALAGKRNQYNTQLIKVVHDHGFKFINPGISSKDGDLFELIKNNTFRLSPRGMTAFWECLSSSVDKLHGNNLADFKTDHRHSTGNNALTLGEHHPSALRRPITTPGQTNNRRFSQGRNRPPYNKSQNSARNVQFRD